MRIRIAIVAVLTSVVVNASCSSCAPAPGEEGEGEGVVGEGEGAEGEGAEGEGAEGEGAEGEGAGAEGEGAEGEGAEGEGGEGEGAEGEGAEGEGGEGEGEGGGCDEDGDCPDSGNFCAPAKCIVDQHVCGSRNLGFGTFIDAQVAGDCNDAICNGDGTATTQVNDGDVGSDDNACTIDGCLDGTPTHVADTRQGDVDQAQEGATGSFVLDRNDDVGQTFSARSGVVTGVEVNVDNCTPSNGSAVGGAITMAISVPQRGFAGSVDVPLNRIGCGAGFTLFDLTSLCIPSGPGIAFDLQIHDVSPGICNVTQCISGNVGALCVFDADCDVIVDVNDDIGDPYAPGSEFTIDGDVSGHDLAFRVHVR